MAKVVITYQDAVNGMMDTIVVNDMEAKSIDDEKVQSLKSRIADFGVSRYGNSTRVVQVEVWELVGKWSVGTMPPA